MAPIGPVSGNRPYPHGLHVRLAAEAAESAEVDVDWASWLRRWEAQQAYYLPDREERFHVMIGLLREVVGSTPSVLDLGSGPGSLARRVVDSLPGARVFAIDADPLLLELGRQAVGDRGGSIRWVEADLRQDSWVELARTWGPVDAALSTTALHWLSPREQAGFFARLAGLIRPGGVFVNGDHLSFDQDQQRIGAAARALQEEEAGRDAAAHPAETWDEWWQAVESEPGLAALAAERRSRWGGHPDYHSPGQALAMQATLRQAGFTEEGTIWQHYENRVVVAIR